MADNEADRIVRARHQQGAANRRSAEEDQQRRQEARIRELATQIEALTPSVLALLKQRGYPGMIEVRLRKNGLFKKGFELKAAWEIGSYPYRFYGDDMTGTLYLLSDGRIGLARSAADVDAAYSAWALAAHLGMENRHTLATCRLGLDELRKKLESGK